MNAEHSKQVVMVCGVSGVGKTHLIRSVLSELPDAVSWRASEIIAEARRNEDPEYLRTLPVDELARSQELLVRSFWHRMDSTPAAWILLDAHCVLDTDEGLFEIDTGIIRRIDPIGFIHIEDHIDRILERRSADTDRRRPGRNWEQLRIYQDRSRDVCRGFAAALRRSMIQIYAGDSDGFLKAIHELRSAKTSAFR